MPVLELTRDCAEKLLDCGRSLGADFVEVFWQRQSEACLSFESGDIDRLWTGTESGAAVRLVRDGNTVCVNANSSDPAVLLKLMRQAAPVMNSTNGGKDIVLRTALPGHGVGSATIPRVDEPLVRAVCVVDASARACSPHVVQVRVIAAETSRRIIVANSDGMFTGDDRCLTTLTASVVSVRNRQRELGFYSLGRASSLAGFLDCHPPSQIGATAAHLSLIQLDAVPAPVGSMPVVVGNGKGGALIHEACVHPLEGDFISRDNSVYRGQLGEMIAASMVTVIDDPVGAGNYPGAYACDDEGTPGQMTVLVEGGRLRSYLTDRVAAARLGHPLTGNGRRQSYDHLPLPRMSNTFIAPGDLDPQEIIAATASGVYARQVSGGEVNQITGEFVFSISEGYLIENGRIGAPIRPTTLVGRGPDVLRAIDMVGCDLELASAHCGKGNQIVPVGLGQPTIRIREMVVGGTMSR